MYILERMDIRLQNDVRNPGRWCIRLIYPSQRKEIFPHNYSYKYYQLLQLSSKLLPTIRIYNLSQTSELINPHDVASNYIKYSSLYKTSSNFPSQISIDKLFFNLLFSKYWSTTILQSFNLQLFKLGKSNGTK